MKDAKRVLQLLNQSNELRGENGVYYDLKDVKGYLKNKMSKFYVCEADNKVVGFFVAEFMETLIYLQTIGVDKKYYGKGVGTFLLNFLEKLARKHKKPFIELVTGVNNKRSQNLFKKLKYKRGKKFYYFFKKLK